MEDPAILTKALESLLIEKGLITSERVDEIVKNYEEDIGPLRGAQVVAKAWVDPEYKARLLADGRAAIAEFGFADPHGTELVVEATAGELARPWDKVEHLGKSRIENGSRGRSRMDDGLRPLEGRI